MRYVDDINNSEVALAVRLQLPSGVTTSSSSNILRKSDLVKDRIRYQENLPPEDKIEIRYQSYSSEDLTEREKTRSDMKMYQRISHEELSSLIDDNVYVPSYVLQYKASETRADGTNPNAELNQKIRREIAARKMMATLPKYMRKMAINADNAEALVSAVEKRTGRIEKAP